MKEVYTYKVAFEPKQFSFEFKSWLFKNKLQDFENFKGTRRYFEDNGDDNPSVYEVKYSGENFIFSMETIINRIELMEFEGEKHNLDKDFILVHKMFFKNIMYIELEIKDEYF